MAQYAQNRLVVRVGAMLCLLTLGWHYQDIRIAELHAQETSWQLAPITLSNAANLKAISVLNTIDSGLKLRKSDDDKTVHVGSPSALIEVDARNPFSVTYYNVSNGFRVGSADVSKTGNLITSDAVWRLGDGQMELVLPLSQPRALDISDDGALIAFAVTQTVAINNLTNGHITSIEAFTQSRVSEIAISPDKSLVAVASDDPAGMIRVFHMADGSFVTSLPGPERQVLSLDFSSDSRQLAAGSSDQSARVWDVSTKEQLAWLAAYTSGMQPVSGVKFSPDGKYLVTSGTDGDLRLWQISPRQMLWSTKSVGSSVTSIDFLGDGTHIYVATTDGYLKVIDAKSGVELAQSAQLRTGMGHRGALLTIALAPNGDTVATSGVRDAAVKLWSPVDHSLLATLPTDGPVLNLHFDSAGRQLVGVSTKETIYIWTVSERKLLATIKGCDSRAIRNPMAGQTGQILATSSDGRLLAFDSLFYVCVWDLERMTLSAKVWHGLGDIDPVGAVFHPDGRRLIVSHSNAGISVGVPRLSEISWRTAQRLTKLGHFGVYNLKILDSGRTLIGNWWPIAGVPELRAWDLGTQKLVFSIKSIEGADLLNTYEYIASKSGHWVGVLRYPANGTQPRIEIFKVSNNSSVATIPVSSGGRLSMSDDERVISIANRETGKITFYGVRK